MANANATSPKEPEFIASLPFRCAQASEPEFSMDVAAWRCSWNICELSDLSACDTITGLYYGSADDPVTKFCPRHFYEMVSRPKADYFLVAPPRLSKRDVEMLVQEADEAFWQVIAQRCPTAKSGDLSPERKVALRLAAEQAVHEWIRNNINPQHDENAAA